MSNNDETKELVFNSYRKSFDKAMAYTKVGISDKEKDILDNDREFQQRLDIVLIEEREIIIQNFRQFMNSDSEQISFKATTEWARTIHPTFFKAPEEKLQEKAEESKSELVQALKLLLSHMSEDDLRHSMDQIGGELEKEDGIEH